MGDVADILGLQAKKTNLVDEAVKVMNSDNANKINTKKIKKPKGMYLYFNVIFNYIFIVYNITT